MVSEYLSLLIAVILMVMIGPEERKADHIKEHMEYSSKDLQNDINADLEKARGNEVEGARISSVDTASRDPEIKPMQ